MWTRSAALFVFLLIQPGIQATEVTGASGPRATQAAKRDDQLCGPLSVHYVLGRFGIDIEKEDVIAEIASGAAGRGSSLQDLGKTLQSRGVHTAAVHIGRNVTMDWPYPVIVHLANEIHEYGHFVVLLPSDKPELRCVLVDRRLRCKSVSTVSPSHFASMRSGAVLLTAPHEIKDPTKAFLHKTESHRPILAGLLVAAIVGGLILIACYARLSRKRQRAPRSRP